MAHGLYPTCMKVFTTRLLYSTVAIAWVMTLMTACNPEKDVKEEKIQRYQSGSIARRYYLVNGKKEGLMTDYFPDGRTRAKRLFTNNRQDGRTVLYYPEGQVKEVQYYSKGLREDTDSIWYQDGTLQFTCSFLNGKKHGYLRKWSPTGEIVFEAKYHQDSVTEIKGASIKVPQVLSIPN
jgi:antitoxin component YwqK of YwqJK toxin-antitoxin module